MKNLTSLVTGLVLLVGTLALQAVSATLAWDYNFVAEPSVGTFKLYSLPGSNSVFTANNANAFSVTTVTKAQAMTTATTLTNGITTNLTATVSNLPVGWWTFTARVVSTNGIESVNASDVSGVVRPAPVFSLQVQ